MNKLKRFFVEIGRIFIRTVIFVYCKIVYRIKIYGKENVPKEGALVFCGNHRTYLDPPLIVVTAGRHMRFMAKEELRKNPLFAFLGVLFEGIYVKRDEKDISALKEALKTLKNGGCIGIFPEGTINREKKTKTLPFKIGAVKMAYETNTKIIPFVITGEYKIFSSSVTIEFLKPRNISKDLEKENQSLREAIEKRIGGEK